MGFWDSFFCHMAANAISEANKETKRHNDLCYQLSDYMQEINNYLKRIGCNQVYIADYGCIDSGSIAIEKRKMDVIKRKVEQYIQLGGDPKCIHDLDEIEDCVEKVRYLKAKGLLDRQQEFVYDDSDFVKRTLELDEELGQKVEENNLKEQMKKQLLNLRSNDLGGILSEKYESNNSEDTIIDCVTILNENIAKQWIENDDADYDMDLLVGNIILTKTNIAIYDWVTNSQIYYKHVFKKKENILVEYIPFSDYSVSIVRLGDLILHTSTDNAKKIKRFFEENEKENLLCTQHINSLSGVEFEKVCQQLVESMGFETETTKASGDGGIDLIAYNYQPLLSGKYIIQCKRYNSSVGESVIRDLYGVITSERANKGILMTTGYFTKSAIAFADGKQIELIDGEKLHELLQLHSVKEFDEDTEENDNLTPQKIFLNNIMIENEYEKFKNTIFELKVVDNEKKRAEFINWLMNLVSGDFSYISDLKEKVVIFHEIKNQIRHYISNERIEKSKLLSYLYQMAYVQLSILEGDFNDARNMFNQLMENRELQLSVFETIKDSPDEKHITDFLYEHQGIFTWLCYTWYDMVQVSILVDDVEYKEYLSDHNLFFGLPVLEKDRLKDTILEFDSGNRTTGNKNYFVERLNGLEEIDSLIYGDVPLKQLFFMDAYCMEVYYKYTYEGSDYSDFAPDFYKIFINGDVLEIEGIGEIKNINQKISRWKRYSKLVSE